MNKAMQFAPQLARISRRFADCIYFGVCSLLMLQCVTFKLPAWVRPLIPEGGSQNWIGSTYEITFGAFAFAQKGEPSSDIASALSSIPYLVFFSYCIYLSIVSPLYHLVKRKLPRVASLSPFALIALFTTVTVTHNESGAIALAYFYVVLNAVLAVWSAWDIVKLLKSPSSVVQVLGCGLHSAPCMVAVGTETSTLVLEASAVINLSSGEKVLQGKPAE